MGSRVTLFIAPASRAGSAWIAAHVLIALLTTVQCVAYLVRLRQVFGGGSEGLVAVLMSYATYFVFGGYLVEGAKAIFHRRWHAAHLSTGINIAVLATAAVATRFLVFFHPISRYTTSWHSKLINEILSDLLALTAIVELAYVLRRTEADRWQQSVYTLCAPEGDDLSSPEVPVQIVTIPSTIVLHAIKLLHVGIGAIATIFAVAFLDQARRHVPPFLRVMFTEPDSWRAIQQHTPDFVAGMIIICGLWTLITGAFVSIVVLVVVYAQAVLQRNYSAAILRNKIHIPLCLAGIIPAWLVTDSPLSWYYQHALLIWLGALCFATAVVETLFVFHCDDPERWDKSVYQLDQDGPVSLELRQESGETLFDVEKGVVEEDADAEKI